MKVLISLLALAISLSIPTTRSGDYKNAILDGFLKLDIRRY